MQLARLVKLNIMATMKNALGFCEKEAECWQSLANLDNTCGQLCPSLKLKF